MTHRGVAAREGARMHGGTAVRTGAAREASSTPRDVVVFCLMLLLSAFGYEFLFLVLTVHVYDLTREAFSVGVFAAITFLPKVFSPVYGVLVDRFDRKT